MIILGNGEPTINLVNKEIGSLYFDKINSVFYVKFSSNEWKLLKELINFAEFEKELEQKINNFYNSIPTNFSIEGRSLVIRSSDETFVHSVDLPTIILEKHIEKVVTLPEVFQPPQIFQQKFIIHKQSSKVFNLTSEYPLNVLEFDNTLYSTFQESIIDGYKNFLLVPTNGLYSIKAKVTIPKSASKKVSISILKDNEELSKSISSSNTFDYFILGTESLKKLSQDDILQVKLESDKEITLSNLEIYLELKD